MIKHLAMYLANLASSSLASSPASLAQSSMSLLIYHQTSSPAPNPALTFLLIPIQTTLGPSINPSQLLIPTLHIQILLQVTSLLHSSPSITKSLLLLLIPN